VRRPQKALSVVALAWAGLTVFMLAVVNLRWEVWQGNASAFEWPAAPAPPGVNLLLLTLYGSIGLAMWLKRHFLKTRNLRRDTTVTAVCCVAVLALGIGVLKAARGVEAALPMPLQSCINDIQPDGSIRFQITSAMPNRSSYGLRKTRFVNGDCFQVEKMTDGQGRPLAFTVTREDNLYRYMVALNERVRPGEMLTTASEGRLSGPVRRLAAPGQFEYTEHHWPATGLDTRRVEIYRLPVGAKILEKKPADLIEQRLPDDRIELRVDQVIPAGGSITVEFRYELPKAQ
jgi:hypothetical protein